MTNRAITVLCVAALAGFAWGQASGTGGAASTTYVGVVIGDNVAVRSGPDESAPACTRLSEPQKVTVAGVKRSWLKVEAPADCYSVVEKDFVKSDLTGQKGTITGSTVFARPAGPLLLSGFALIQRRLREGETVDIIGATGKYYKITSPPGAYFWIAKQYVASESEYKATARARKASLVPVGPRPPDAETARVEPVKAGPGTTKVGTPPAGPDPEPRGMLFPPPKLPPRAKTPAAPPRPAGPLTPREAFQAAEEAFKAECGKTADLRDYEAVLAKYQAIQIGDQAYLGPYIAERVNFLQQAIEDRKTLAEAEKLLKESAAKQKEYDLKLSQAEVAIPAEARRSDEYAAKGIVMASGLFPGGATAPKRYLLRDPKTRGIQAYLQSTTGEVDLASYDGKYVGIIGKSRYDAALMANVIEVQLIVQLDEDVRLPEPPRPTVTPVAPRPAPPTKAEAPVTPAPVVPATPPPLPAKRPGPEAPIPVPPRAPETPKKAPAMPPPLPPERPARPVTPPLEPTGKTPPPVTPIPPEPPRTIPPAPPVVKPAPKAPPPTRPVLLPGPGPVTPPPVKPVPKKPASPVPPPPLDMPLEPGPATKAPSVKPTTRPATPEAPKTPSGKGLPLVDPTRKPTKPPVDAKEFQ